MVDKSTQSSLVAIYLTNNFNATLVVVLASGDVAGRIGSIELPPCKVSRTNEYWYRLFLLLIAAFNTDGAFD